MKRSVLILSILLLAVTPVIAQSGFEKNVKKLKEGSWGAKEEAAERLAWLRDPRAIPALKEALKDESWHVRVAAAKALLAFNDKTGLNMFISELARTHKEVPVGLFQAVLKIGSPDFADAVAKFLSHEIPDIRKVAAYTLARLGNKSVGKALTENLQDKEPAVRRACAFALGELECSEAVEALIKLLESDAAPEVRHACAQALGQIGNEKAVKGLKGRLKDRETARNPTDVEHSNLEVFGLVERHIEEPVALAVVRALGEIGTEKAVDALVRCAKRKDPLTLELAVYHLGEIGDKRAIEPLKSLTEPGEQIPDYLLMALVILGDKSVTKLLVEQVISPDTKIRRLWSGRDIGYAVAGLGLEDELLAAIRKVLRDRKSSDVQKEAAVRALHYTGKEKEAVPELIEIVRTGPPKLKYYVVERLDNAFDERATEVLMKHAQQEKGGRLEYAIRALGYTRDKKCSDFIIMNYFNHPNSRVRGQAIKAMLFLKDPRAIPALKKSLETEKVERDRREAAQAICAAAGEKDVPLLVKILRNEKNNGIRYDITRSLFRLIRAKKAREAILSLLKSKDTNDVSRVLGYIAEDYPGFKEAVPHIMPLLAEDKSAKIRLKAMSTLKLLMDEEVVDKMVSLLEDKDDDVAFRAATILTIYGDERGIDILIKTARNNEAHASNRRVSLAVIGEQKILKAEDAALEALKAPDPSVQVYACICLGEAGMEKGRGPMWKILNDPEKKKLHYYAAYGLVCLRDERVGPILQKMIETEENYRTKHGMRRFICKLKGITPAQYYRPRIEKIDADEWYELIHRTLRRRYEEDYEVLKMVFENHPSYRIRGQAAIRLRTLTFRMEKKKEKQKELDEVNKLLEQTHEDKEK